jgi:hypothetical protein
MRRLCNEAAVSGREIVENDHRLAAIKGRENHVAADITGTARDQYRHGSPLTPLPPS